MLYKIKFALILLLLFTLYSCNENKTSSKASVSPSTSSTPVINYTVTNYFPHDTALFTEGFLIHDGQLFESTGSPEDLPQTRSVVGITDIATGKFTKKIELDRTKYFGEGIVILNNKLYQLTYKNQQGFIYNVKTFKKTGAFKLKNKEGWSLTTDGKNLIMSDGTDTLTFLDPADLKPISILKVTENGMPRDRLNELEFIKGFIYANTWQNNSIIKIDPGTGKVVGKLDMSSLVYESKNKNPRADVLNGIAYDSATDKIYVTGKLWANIYQINFSH